MILVLLAVKNLPGMNYIEYVKETTESCTQYKIMGLLFGSLKLVIEKKYIAEAIYGCVADSVPSPLTPGVGTKTMMKNLLFIKTIFVAILIAGLASANEPSVNWEAFSASLHTYFDYPSQDNAKAAYQLLPSSGHVRMTGAKIEMVSLEYFYSNARILERQVISGDFNSVMLAFRLFSITDAAYSEELDIMLGKPVEEIRGL